MPQAEKTEQQKMEEAFQELLSLQPQQQDMQEAMQELLAARNQAAPGFEELSRSGLQFGGDVLRGTTGETAGATAGSVGGQIAGGAVGTALTGGNPVGTVGGRFLGGMIGAGLGGLGGSASTQLQETGELDLQQMLDAAERQVIGEGIGETVFGIGKRALKTSVAGPVIEAAFSRLVPFRSKVTPQGRISSEFFQEEIFPGDPDALGPPIPQITRSKILDWLGNFTAGSPFSSRLVDTMETLARHAERVARRRADELGELISPTELGTLIKGILDGRVDVGRATKLSIQGEIIEEARRLLRGAEPTIRTGSIVEFMNKVVAKKFPSAKLPSMDGPMSLEAAFTFRDQLAKLASELEGPEAAVLDAASKRFDKEIRGLLAALDKQLVRKLDVSNEAEKQLDEYIRSLVSKGNPDMLIDSLLNDLRSPFYMRGVMQALEGTPEAAFFRGRVYKRILDEAVNERTGLVEGTKLKRLVRGVGETEFRGITQESLGIVFPKEEVTFMNIMADALTELQARQAGGSGTVVSQMASAGAIGSLAGAGAAFGAGGDIGDVATGSVIGGLGVLLSPAAMGRIFTNPKARRLLLIGVKLKPGNPALRQITSRIVAILQAEDEARDRLSRLDPSDDKPDVLRINLNPIPQ